MTREALIAGRITLESMKEALALAKGDLFLTASHLGCTAREIDSYIRASQELQAYAAAIERVKQDEAYHAMSVKQFEDAIASRLLVYRVDAIDALHELAIDTCETIVIDGEGNALPTKSAAMAKVKMEAAKALMGSQTGQQSAGIEATLEELNRLYHEHAPSIREIRQTTTTLVLSHEKAVN